MPPRFADVGDAPEIVRLARLMFASMGLDLTDPTWEHEARRHVETRLGDDMAAFVVDHPDGGGRLIASASGTITRRLPTPRTPLGLAGYIQWVCTEPEHRGEGLARAVMTSLLDWYRSRGVPIAELHATPMAESLYLSMGFADADSRALRRSL